MDGTDLALRDRFQTIHICRTHIWGRKMKIIDQKLQAVDNEGWGWVWRGIHSPHLVQWLSLVGKNDLSLKKERGL